MPLEERRFSRQDLLDALEQGWKQYLPRLAALSEEEQAHFASTLLALEQLLLDLPETALEDERLHRWLRVETIDHYQEHRLPGPSEKAAPC